MLFLPSGLGQCCCPTFRSRDYALFSHICASAHTHTLMCWLLYWFITQLWDIFRLEPSCFPLCVCVCLSVARNTDGPLVTAAGSVHSCCSRGFSTCGVLSHTWQRCGSQLLVISCSYWVSPLPLALSAMLPLSSVSSSMLYPRLLVNTLQISAQNVKC